MSSPKPSTVSDAATVVRKPLPRVMYEAASARLGMPPMSPVAEDPVPTTPARNNSNAEPSSDTDSPLSVQECSPWADPSPDPKEGVKYGGNIKGKRTQPTAATTPNDDAKRGPIRFDLGPYPY